MTAPLSPDADRVIADIAVRHGLSREAVLAMLHALQVGGGTMAQFDIPELGGSGQWMRGGMTMVGNMFDTALKARVDALCAELSQLLASSDVLPARRDGSAAGGWWPSDLGVPSATGGQNDARYAVFLGTRRLAIQDNGGTRVFDTGDHRIDGVQQQQGGRAGLVTFTSQLGTFDVSSLTEVGARQAPATPPAPAQPSATAPGDAGAIIASIEALAGLHERGILSDAEFSAKKTELLGRL